MREPSELRWKGSKWLKQRQLYSLLYNFYVALTMKLFNVDERERESWIYIVGGNETTTNTPSNTQYIAFWGNCQWELSKFVIVVVVVFCDYVLMWPDAYAIDNAVSNFRANCKTELISNLIHTVWMSIKYGDIVLHPLHWKNLH